MPLVEPALVPGNEVPHVAKHGLVEPALHEDGEAVAARDVAVLVPVQLGEGLSEPRNLLGAQARRDSLRLLLLLLLLLRSWLLLLANALEEGDAHEPRVRKRRPRLLWVYVVLGRL